MNDVVFSRTTGPSFGTVMLSTNWYSSALESDPSDSRYRSGAEYTRSVGKARMPRPVQNSSCTAQSTPYATYVSSWSWTSFSTSGASLWQCGHVGSENWMRAGPSTAWSNVSGVRGGSVAHASVKNNHMKKKNPVHANLCR